MSQSLATRYPLVLVPGMLGFVRIGFFPYWYGIVPALRAGGAQVFPIQVAPLDSSEVRGEQLLAQIARDEQALADPALYTRDPAKFAALTKAIETARAEKDAAEERWLELAELVES